MKNIIDFIPVGKNNAITGKELQNITGLDGRSVKQQIANARIRGAVICASLNGDGGGYFIPSCPSEATEYVRTEQCRINSAKAALKAAEIYVSDGDYI
ncbi:MAG: hypothetical protein K2J08_06020 [Ruminococcus sp.]|nr:hypothetical protein [Ruminococcus sp.]